MEIFRKKITMHQLSPIKTTMLRLWGKVLDNERNQPSELKFGSRKRNVQDNEMILRETSTKWSRNRVICSRYQQVRDIESSRYYSSPCFVLNSPQSIFTIQEYISLIFTGKLLFEKYDLNEFIWWSENLRADMFQ